MGEFDTRFSKEMKNNTSETKKIFLKEINVLSGIAIFTVVIGHLSFLNDIVLYIFLRNLIYSFHMPLFMAISGYLFSRFSRKKIYDFKSYKKFIIKKFFRFVPPYVFLVSFIFVLKIMASNIFQLKHPVSYEAFLMMFVNPMFGGFVVHLWFVYALFIIFLLYPLLEKVFAKIDIRLRLAIYCLLATIPMTKVCCLNFVFHYMPYFHLGAMLVGYKINVKDKLANMLFVSFLLFACASVCQLKFDFIYLNSFWSITQAFAGSLFVTLFAILVSKKDNPVAFFFFLVGSYSFEIYLLHTVGSEIFGYGIMLFKFPALHRSIIIFIGSTIFGLFFPILFTKLLNKVFPKQAIFLLGKVN